MKIDFDVYFISQCVGAKCSNPKECKDKNLCVTCKKVNFMLAIPLSMNIWFEAMAAPKMYREFNPGKGIHCVSSMFVIAYYYAGLMFTDSMCDPTQKMNSVGQEQWHRQVKQKRALARTFWEEGKEKFHEGLRKFQQSPTPVDTVEFLRFMEERLYAAKAIFDVVNGDTKDPHDKDAVDWFKALYNEGNKKPHWSDGQKWMMKKFGTVRLVKWTRDMEVCEADNVQAWLKEVDRFNEMRKEITDRISAEVALDDEAKKFAIVADIVTVAKKKANLPKKEKTLLEMESTCSQGPMIEQLDSEEEDPKNKEEEEEEEGPHQPSEAMSRIARHLAAVQTLDIENKPKDFDLVREAYGKEQSEKAKECTVVEMQDGKEEEGEKEEEEGEKKEEGGEEVTLTLNTFVVDTQDGKEEEEEEEIIEKHN